MDPQLLKVLLYIPFLAVVAIVGIIYCIKGYKQGLWRALISLGVTVGCAVISLVASRLLAGGLAGVLASLVPLEMLDDVGSLKDFVYRFVEGLTGDLLAILLFSLLFFLSITILKCVGNRLVRRETFNADSKVMKWAGLGVRVADAVLVALLLLLPLYGTIATYISPATRVAQMAYGTESEAVRYMSAVSDHAVVNLYKQGPAAWVQNGLSGFKVGEANVDLAEIAALLNEALEKYEHFCSLTDDEEQLEALADLGDFLRENLIEEEWFFSMVSQLATEAEQYLTEIPDESVRYYVTETLKLVNTSQEVFASNGIAVLDFASYLLDPENMEFLEAQTPENLPAEFEEKLGNLLNHSEQAAGLKKILLTAAAAELFDNYEYAVNSEISSDGFASSESAKREEEADRAQKEAARKAMTDAIAFVDGYWKGDGLVSGTDSRIREARAFLRLLSGSNNLTLVEGFARHPFFGSDAVLRFLDKDNVDSGYGLSTDDAEYVRDNFDWISGKLKSHLETCAAMPLTYPSLEEVLDGILAVEFHATEVAPEGVHIEISRGSAQYIVNTYGELMFREIPGGETVSRLLPYFLQTDAKHLNISDLAYLCAAAEDTSLWPDEKKDVSMGDGQMVPYTTVVDGKEVTYYVYSATGTGDDPATKSYRDFVSALNEVIFSKGALESMKLAVGALGRDPYGLGKNLSAAEIECLNGLLADIVSGNSYMGGSAAILGSVSGSGNADVKFQEYDSENAGSSQILYYSGDGAVGNLSFSAGTGSGGSYVISGSVGARPELSAEEKAAREASCNILKDFFGIAR